MRGCDLLKLESVWKFISKNNDIGHEMTASFTKSGWDRDFVEIQSIIFVKIMIG
jgi:hypothetical protein